MGCRSLGVKAAPGSPGAAEQRGSEAQKDREQGSDTGTVGQQGSGMGATGHWDPQQSVLDFGG